MVALTCDQIQVDKVYMYNNKEIRIVKKYSFEEWNEEMSFVLKDCINYYYLDNPVTQITCPFEGTEIFAVPEAQAPPPLMGLFPRMEVYNKHVPTIICSEDGKIIKVEIPDNAHTPHILSIDMGDGRMVDLPTYNRIIIDKFYNTPTKETTLEFLKISEIRGLEGSMEEQISKILEHFPDGIIVI
uniref:Uncharacterized protein n=1 Tax=viral metagenome TaxID=1070528 RepID=A0A6C0LCA1_9ZZZZ